MNSDANPVLTLVWTFGLMSLFAVGGANSAIPEMHRIAVDVQHWMTDKQFADVFAISQLSPGPNVLIVTLIGYSVAGVAGALAATLAMCGPTAVLAYYVSRLLARSSHSRWPAIIQAALVPLSIGLMAASGLILALTSDRNWVAALMTVAAAVLAFATRLNPLWMLLAGGVFGFCWRYLTKIASKASGTAQKLSNQNGRASPVRGERSMSDTPSHGPVKSIMPKWVRGPQDFVGGLALMAIALFALWASSDLQGMRGFSFGAGTAPRMFGVLLLAARRRHCASWVCVADGPQLANYHWRGPLFVSLSILCFAVAIRPLGLVVSAFATFLIAALGTPETRWKETIIVGICLTIGCSLLFPYALGLPMQLFPRFLIQ